MFHRLLRTALPALGSLVALSALSALGSLGDLSLLMAPFGASCVILFALPDSPLAQARNVIGGHVVSTLTGLIMLHVFGNHAWTLAVAAALSVCFMQLTRTLHPPAGADPIVVLLSGAGWSFLATPVLAGSIVLVGLGAIYRQLLRPRVRPQSPASVKTAEFAESN